MSKRKEEEMSSDHPDDDDDESAKTAMYMVLEHAVEEPAYSVFRIDAAAAAGCRRARHLVRIPASQHGMSFAAVHSKRGRSWIVGVGGGCDATIFYDPTHEDRQFQQGPRLMSAKRDPVLISHGRKLYSFSRRYKVDPDAHYEQPWFEYLSLGEDGPGSGFWLDLPSPPFSPFVLTPRQYLDPPEICVLAYAAVGSYILLSLQPGGTFAFHVRKVTWAKLDEDTLPFVGDAVHIGRNFFASRSRASRSGATAVFYLKVFDATSSEPARLSVLEFPEVASLPGGGQQLLCPLGLRGGGSFCSVDLMSSRHSSRQPGMLKTAQVVVTACQMKTEDSTGELQVLVNDEQRQIYRFCDRTRFLASPMPLVAVLSIVFRVKEGVDDATRARMNSEMKAVRPSLRAKSVARLSESRKGALSKQVLSRLSMSVMALASFDGNTKLRECTGICIESSCPDAMCLLTSTNLIPFSWPRRKITESLRIEVRLPNNQIVTGWIEDPQIYVDFFIVKIKNVVGIDATHLSHLSLDRVMQYEPYRKVAAVWRDFDSGEFKTTSGVDLASFSAHPDEKMLSTCQIHEVGIGGPLVDFDGNFIGMNCSGTEERKTPYVQRPSIREFMWFRGMVSVKEEVDDDAERARIKSRFGESCFRGGRYINRLDDIFEKDILRKPFKGVGLEMDRSAYSLASESSKRLASEMDQSVVSLASFNGFAKKFSCTGVFIKDKACSATILTSASLVRVPGSAHMIDDNLRIEVCLPNRFRVVGILKCYNLHYNVALVEIIGFWRPRRIKISGDPVTSPMDVIAVGSLFAHRKLMAVEGKVLIGKQSELDCRELCVSTCKITKAGIGGPLIDIDGNFVGMNFYDEEETPFLPRDVIHRLLNNKWSSADDTIVEGVENRWLLPGGTHRNADAIAAVGGNKWTLPEPRRRVGPLDHLHLRKQPWSSLGRRITLPFAS